MCAAGAGCPVVALARQWKHRARRSQSLRFAIVVFPGTWSDRDCYHVLTDVLGQEAEYVWHKETDLDRFDAVVLPGGFSYGDYLRCGAIARFSPVMEAVARHADR